jgi:hypothetical protein
VTARAKNGDACHVGGRGDWPGSQRHLADIDLGIAVNPQHRADTAQRSGVDHAGRPTRQRLLGRFEDESEGAGEFALLNRLGERQRRTEYHRGVHVVATRMGHTRQCGPIRHVLLILHGERVQVGAQRHHRATVGRCLEGRCGPRGQIAHQPGALGQLRRRKTGDTEPVDDRRRGLHLGPRHLGMSVQTAAKRHQFVEVGIEKPVEPWGHRLG